MLTALGRFLRKIRIDRNELLKDMADKLEVSASFLSAVENGKRACHRNGTAVFQNCITSQPVSFLISQKQLQNRKKAWIWFLAR